MSTVEEMLGLSERLLALVLEETSEVGRQQMALELIMAWRSRLLEQHQELLGRLSDHTELVAQAVCQGPLWDAVDHILAFKGKHDARH